MARSEHERRLTANWLASNAQIYKSPDRIQPDVLAVLDRVPTLRPKTDIYTYDDGRTQLLLCIHGTLPINYRGATYNIPVTIWPTLDYPKEPPIVYVVPTSDMLVRQSPYVDLSGRCDLEYMRNWRVKPDSCSVQGLIDAMADQFSLQPPLYAKPRVQAYSVPRTSNSSSPVSLSSPAAPDHDRVGHVRPSPPPPLPRKPQSSTSSVGVGLHPSSEHKTSSSPSPSYSYPHAHLPASQSQSYPQTSHVRPVQVQNLSTIPPQHQVTNRLDHPLGLAPLAQTQSSGPSTNISSSLASPDHPPPLPPLPTDLRSALPGLRDVTSSTSRPNSFAALSTPAPDDNASPPPYRYAGLGSGNVRLGERDVIAQQQGHAIQQPQLQRQLQLQQGQEARVTTTPASPPPLPPVPPSPFRVVQHQQERRQQHDPRFSVYDQHAQNHHGFGITSPTQQQIQIPQASSPEALAQAPVPAISGGQQWTAVPQGYASSPSTAHSYSSPGPILQQQQQMPAPQATPVPPPDLLSSDDTEPSVGPPTVLPQAAPAPPRPPNPELQRLHTSLHTLVKSSLGQLQVSCAEAQAKQLELQRALLAGPPAIEDESARLVAVRDVCRGVGARLRDVVGRTESVIAEVRRRGEVEVDEMVCATSIVGNQIINLVAEDNAIEDTMYHLHRALNTGRIDLERFLRTTRVLAEEQFMKRALVEKIQRGLPMGMSIHA